MSSYLLPAGTWIEVNGYRVQAAVPFEITGQRAAEAALVRPPHAPESENPGRAENQRHTLDGGPYRILTNGTWFKVQRRGWLWGWNDVRDYASGIDEDTRCPTRRFPSRDAAQAYIDAEEQRTAEWRLA